MITLSYPFLFYLLSTSVIFLTFIFFIILENLVGIFEISTGLISNQFSLFLIFLVFFTIFIPFALTFSSCYFYTGYIVVVSRHQFFINYCYFYFLSPPSSPSLWFCCFFFVHTKTNLFDGYSYILSGGPWNPDRLS